MDSARDLRDDGVAWSLVACGALALAVGLLVYLSDRSGARPWPLSALPSSAPGPLFGALGGWLPSFVHALAFGLFTVALLPARAGLRYGACAAWGAADAVFELGQHPRLAAPLAQRLHEQFGDGAAVRTLANYFVHGTFDRGDIVAALLGALAAALLLRTLMHDEGTNHG